MALSTFKCILNGADQFLYKLFSMFLEDCFPILCTPHGGLFSA